MIWTVSKPPKRIQSWLTFLRYLSLLFVVTLANFSFSCTTSEAEVVQTIGRGFWLNISSWLLRSAVLDGSLVLVSPEQNKVNETAAVLSQLLRENMKFLLVSPGIRSQLRLKEHNRRAIANKYKASLNTYWTYTAGVTNRVGKAGHYLTFIFGR